jgi:hypothetical protein
MAAIADLKPTQKFLVMDLLAEANFDVSDWKRYKGKTPAANPKYCYNWSFEQPGEAFAVCLWYSGLKKNSDEIYHSFSPASRAARTKEPGSANWNKRADELHDRIDSWTQNPGRSKNIIFALVSGCSSGALNHLPQRLKLQTSNFRSLKENCAGCLSFIEDAKPNFDARKSMKQRPLEDWCARYPAANSTLKHAMAR